MAAEGQHPLLPSPLGSSGVGRNRESRDRFPGDPPLQTPPGPLITFCLAGKEQPSESHGRDLFVWVDGAYHGCLQHNLFLLFQMRFISRKLVVLIFK